MINLFHAETDAAVFFILEGYADFKELLPDAVGSLIVFFSFCFVADIDQQIHNAIDFF